MVDRRFMLLGGGAALALALGRPSRSAAAAFPLTLTDVQWKSRLKPDQYEVLRRAATELPFTSPLLNEHRARHLRLRRLRPATCSRRRPSSTAAPAGRASGRRWTKAVGTDGGHVARHGPHRGALQPLRRPPGPCVRRRAEADRPALLHERRGPDLHARPRPDGRPTMILFLLAYLGGVLTIVSPCILPVLPFVFARADQPFVQERPADAARHGARPSPPSPRWPRSAAAGRCRPTQYGRIAALVLLALLRRSRCCSRRWPTALTRPLVALGARLSRIGADGSGRRGGVGRRRRCCSASPRACCGRPAPGRSWA